VEEKIAQIQKEYLEKISQSTSLKELDGLFLDIFGKNGAVTLLPKDFSKLPEDARKKVGPLFNTLKQELEKAIEFSEDIGKFSKNFNVAYSGYLTMLYGFKDQAEFDAKYTPIVARWNRVIARIKNGDKMTDKNNEVIKEIERRRNDALNQEEYWVKRKFMNTASSYGQVATELIEILRWTKNEDDS